MITIEHSNNKNVRNGIYIGRPSLFGNPFRIGADGTRAEVIAKYRVWLREQYAHNPTVRQQLEAWARQHQSGRDLIFVCWCAPFPCHGDVIKDAVEKISETIACTPT